MTIWQFSRLLSHDFFKAYRPRTDRNCIHVSCFGQDHCIKKTETNDSGFFNEKYILLHETKKEDFCGHAEPCAKEEECKHGDKKYIATESINALLRNDCGHPVCVGLAECLKEQGEQEIKMMLAQPDTFMAKGNAIHLSSSEWYWDSDSGWAWKPHCSACNKRRCPQCIPQTFESVSGLKDALTFENVIQRLCLPCPHGECRGGKVKVICRCEECAHAACEKCLVDKPMCHMCGEKNMVVLGEEESEKTVGGHSRTESTYSVSTLSLVEAKPTANHIAVL